MPTQKEELQLLLKRFGKCGCKDRCMLEQFGESGADRKPRGRFSVCELVVEKQRLESRKPSSS